MLNLDLVNQKKEEILQKMVEAVGNNDNDAFVQGFNALCENIQERVLAEHKAVQDGADVSILNARGVRQLTSQEREYYQKVIEAMKSPNPQQSLAGLDVVMPKSTFDEVFEDLTDEHPLLDVINFQNTSGLMEFLVNTHENELAQWGTLTSEIVKQLTSGFKKVNMSMNKLSAFFPISKAMLDLGPEWLDRYIRLVLSDALANGLEEGIINGTGKDMPIGMNRQVGKGVTVTDGEHPEKATIVLKEINPEEYGKLLSKLVKTPNGHYRKIAEVIMIVNPEDYLQTVMPATTYMTPDKKYVNDVFPFPTKVIQSIHVKKGRAILGIAKRYFMGVGTGKEGKVEFSDDYKFLEDERVYLVKLYGHGEPLDNNAFLHLDISKLKRTVPQVAVVGQ